MIRLAWAVYLPMIAAAFFVRPPGSFAVGDWADLALGMGVAAGVGGAAITLSRLVARRTDWGRRLFAEFHALLGGLSSPQILTLSLLSAFGEEILFRGVIHPWLGLWFTAAVFAGFHFPYRRRLVPWTVFAGVLGVVLGLLTDTYGSLWPAILLHFMVNYFNIHDLAEERPPAPEAS